MTRARVDALVLAAGLSRRLGAPKALVTLPDGRTLLTRAVEAARAAGLAVTVAVPAGSGAVADEAARAGARSVEVEGAAAGMSASVRAGTLALAADPTVDGILILLVDQWRLTPTDLTRLLAAWESGGRAVAAARYASVVGVPALFGRRRFDVLLGASGDAGARAYLRRSAADVTPVDLPNAATDLDTAADLHDAGGR